MSLLRQLNGGTTSRESCADDNDIVGYVEVGHYVAEDRFTVDRSQRNAQRHCNEND